MLLLSPGAFMTTPQWKRRLQSPQPQAWALEARLMFDAAAVVDVVQQATAAHDAVATDTAHPATQEAVQPEAPAIAAPAVSTDGVQRDAGTVRELLFIDAQVEDRAALLAGLRAGVQVVELQAGSDPWAQMTRAIGQHDGLAAIHIVSHGAAGTISLGGQTYRAADLPAQAAELQQWQPHLAAGADLLIYGCDVGAGAEGAALLATLSQQTQADVAASTNATGAASHGGDWVLETATGSIEAGMALAEGYDGLLPNLGAPPGGSTWRDVMVGSNYDPSNDQQANSKQDLVGDASNAMLQATQDATDPSNPVYYFRARYGDTALIGTSFYLAMDVNGDMVADVFVEAQVASNGATKLVYHAVDPTKAGTGPSTTGWLNSSNDTSKELTASTTASYVAVSSAGTDLDASSSGTDSWLTFGFTLNSLKSFSPAASVTGSTTMVLYAFTATSQTANGDIAGVNDNTANLSLTWAQLGLGISTSLETITTTSFGTPTVSVSNVTVSEASPYAVFAVNLDVASPSAISFTPTLVSGTAAAGTDTGAALEYYNGSSWVSAAGGVTVSGGTTQVLVRAAITQDSVYEGSESFTLSTGTITGSVTNSAGASGTGTIKDDGSSTNVFLAGNTTATATAGSSDSDVPTLSVSSPTVAEGGYAVFTVSLDHASTSAVSFTPSLAGVTATLGTDTAASNTLQVYSGGSWVAVSGAVTIPAGATSVQLRLQTSSDGSTEASETFTLSTGALTGTLTSNGSVTGTATITDAATNSAPVAVDDTLGATEDTAVTFAAADLTGNDTDADGNSLSIASVGNGTGGTVVLNGDGTVTFTPSANFSGAATFTYTVSDGTATSNTATATVNVSAVNDAPVAAGATVSTNEDTALSGSLPSATDTESDTVTYAKATDPAHGTVTVGANGSYTYAPTANYHGSDSFTYTVSDGNGGSNTYTISITVNAVNDAPVAAGATVSTNEDTALSGSLPSATDAESDTVTYAKATDPTHGTVTVGTTGSYTYTPTANYHGSDSFTYTVSDGNGGSNTYTVSITVNAVNDAPVAAGATVSTNEDTALSGSLPSATDTENDTVTYAKATDPTHGTVTVNANGSYTYSPTANYHGSDSFTYTVSDGNGGSNTYTVSITVNAVNDAPVASGATVSTNEDTALSGNLPAATDTENDTVTYAKATDPTNGTVTVNANGSYTYTPAANYHGSDSFTYTVSDGNGGSNTYTINITVNAVNDAPVAAGATVSTNEDTALSGNLPTATDTENDTVTYAKATDPTNGTVTVNANGSYTYTPAANYHGSDSFTYTVSDGNGGSNTYTINITVNAVNDAPVASGATVSTNEDTVLSGNLPTATDAESDSVTYAKATDPTNGTVTVNANGSYTYTPTANYHGSDSFTYTVSDGNGGSNTYTVSITVNAVNDAPVATGATVSTNEDTALSGSLPSATDAENDTVTYAKATDPTNGTVTVTANGSYTYTPTANYHGSDSFTYTVSDGNGGSNTYTISITVNAVNDAPVAAGATVSTNEDTALSGSLPSATDTENDTVTYAKATDPAHGTVTVNANGSYTYTPTANYHGSDSFTYTVSDGNGGSNTYTISITVNAVNDAPVAAGTTVTTNEDTGTSGNLPAATDTDNDAVTYAKATDPAHGTVTVNADGSYTYTPQPGYHGADSFSYAVSDGEGGTATCTATITVSDVNDPPVAANDALAATEDTPVTLAAADLLGNDTDADGQTLSIVSVASGTGGTVVLDGDGSITFTPAPDFHGTATFSYTVTDGSAQSNAATATVVVGAVNDAPAAAPATLVTAEDAGAQGQLPTAADADGDTLVYTRATDAEHGTVTVNADGNYTYTPVANYHGTDSFSYTVSDGQGLTRTYTVSITVTPVNDAPLLQPGTATTAQDTAWEGQLPTATDPDGDALSYSLAQAPSHGSVVIDADGHYAYTPAPGFHGTDSFLARVQDADGGVQERWVTVQVLPAPSLALPASYDLGVSASDRVTTAPVVTLAGEAAPNQVLRLYSPAGQLVAQVQADGAGRWSAPGIDLTAMRGDAAEAAPGAPGAYTFSVRAVLGLGRESAAVPLTVVREIPPPPVEAPPVQPQAQPAPVAAPVVAERPADPPAAAAPAFDTLIAAPSRATLEPPRSPEPAAPVRLERSSSGGDIYTRPSGFQIMVARSSEPSLRLFRGIDDQVVPLGRTLIVQVPADAFMHTVITETVVLNATLADGRPLPAWLMFDGKSGKFVGQPPADLAQDLAIRINARDSQGREASTMFRIKVGTASHSLQRGLNQQLASREALALAPSQRGWQPVSRPAGRQ
jgi:VCBS repeat-containing protein